MKTSRAFFIVQKSVKLKELLQLMLKKSQFFYFFSSLVIAIVAGFFIWNIFFNSNINILAKFFPASLSAIPEITDIIPAIDLQESTSQDLVPSDVEIVITQPTRQDIIDDVQEKLDIISAQVQELVDQQNFDNQIANVDKVEVEDHEDHEEQEVAEGDIDLEKEDSAEQEEIGGIIACTGQININTASPEDLDKIISVGPVTAQKIIEGRPFCFLNDLLRVNGIGETTLQKIITQGCAYAGGLCGGGGSSSVVPTPTVYPKILISEVQIAGVTADDEFIELYNPNDTDVNLDGYTLKKKTKGGVESNLVSSASFTGIIPKLGYFLIVPHQNDDGSEKYTGLAVPDLHYSGKDYYISADSTVLLYKKDDSLSDKVGWGQAVDYEGQPVAEVDEGQSVGRKTTEDDTDNNLADFEIDTPTPGMQNTIFVPPDTTAPVITLIGDSEITVNVGDIYTDEGATASDDVDGDITANILTDGSVDADTVGDYTIRYNVSDVAGNKAVEVSRLVHVLVVTKPPVVDTTSPTILSFYPSNNSIDVPVDAKPTLTFSEPLDFSTVNNSDIQLREYATLAADAKQVQPMALTLAQDGVTLGFYLSSPLQYNKQYYFFVGSGVKDIAGNSFAKSTWYHAQRDSHEFTTIAE